MPGRSPTGTTSGRRATTTTWPRGPTRLPRWWRRPSSPGIPGRARRSTWDAAPGWSAERFAREDSPGQILGLDISQASLEIARQCGAYDSLEQADLQQRLAFEDDSVDAVICVGVMTYLPDVEAVWREFARVARPGGLVVATQREDLWHARTCPAVVDRLRNEGVWTPLQITGPATYLPEGYGGTPEVACYYLTALVS